MAGSFRHMVGDDEKLTFDLLENGADCIEALADCWNLIVELTGGDMKKVERASKAMIGPGKVYPGTYVPPGPDAPRRIFHTRY